jgi:hypothetical protein
MAEHKLLPGEQVINDLLDLGRTLGYHVQRELPVLAKSRNNQAIDLAWLSEKGQRFPLMIFEIETKAQNKDANNALKVFGKSTQVFEKPLFFFHVFVQKGQNSAGVEDLQETYRTHNYRLYRFALDDETNLLKDIFSQHRRLTRELDLFSVFPSLNRPTWRKVDLESVILYIEELSFDCVYNSLQDYALLSQTHPEFLSRYLRILQKNYSDSDDRDALLSAYLSMLGMWPTPVHLGILVANVEEEQKREYFRKLKEWQEIDLNEKGIRQLGINLPLVLMFNYATPLLALIAALMRDIPEAGLYLAEQCNYILDFVKGFPCEMSLFVALWMLYIAASSNLAKGEFETAREFINSSGGIPENAIYEPPGILYIHEELAWSLDNAKRVYIPALQDFKKNYKGKHLTSKQRNAEATSLTIKILTDMHYWKYWSKDLIRLFLV